MKSRVGDTQAAYASMNLFFSFITTTSVSLFFCMNFLGFCLLLSFVCGIHGHVRFGAAVKEEESVDFAPARCEFETLGMSGFKMGYVGDISHVKEKVFQITASNDASVLLGSDRNAETKGWEILFGGDSNLISLIRSYKGQTLATHTGILHLNFVHLIVGRVLGYQARSFWLSWKDEYLRVGSGAIVGQNELMKASKSELNVEFLHMHATTSRGSNGKWKFCLDPLVTSTCNNLFTPSIYDYASHFVKEVSGVDSFTFSVIANNDAHLALSSSRDANSQELWEIVLGGWSNSQSAIRSMKQGENLVTAVGAVLNNLEMSDFWVNWTSSLLQVGIGKVVGQNVLMKIPHNNKIAIDYLHISTGWGASGLWNFCLN